MIATHFDAVEARLTAHPQLAGKVNDTVKTNTDGTFVRTNYVVLFGGAPDELGGDRATRQQVAGDNAVFDYTVRAVGISSDAVRQLLQAVHAQLVDWTPQIADRRCRPVKFTGGSELRPENSVKPPLYFQDSEFELRSFFTSGGS